MKETFKSKLFVSSRGVGRFGDISLEVAFPLFLASLGLLKSDLGIAVTIISIGTIISSFFFPYLTKKFGALQLSRISNSTQAILMLLAGFGIYFVGSINYLYPAIVSLLFLDTFFAMIWFNSSEVFIPLIFKKEELSSVHSKQFSASNLGQLLGTSTAPFLFSVFTFFGVLVVNVLSFILQEIWFRSLDKKLFVHKKEKWNISELNLFRPVFKYRDLAVLSLIAILVKVFILGFTPFLIFKIASADLAVVSSVSISTFLGGFIGSALYKYNHMSLLRGLVVESSLMFIAQFGIFIVLSFNLSFLYLIPLNFLVGLFLAFFTIRIRVYRANRIVSLDMASVVSSITLWVRVLSPISGIYFGYLFHYELSHILYLFTFISIFLILLYYKLNSELNGELNE